MAPGASSKCPMPKEAGCAWSWSTWEREEPRSGGGIQRAATVPLDDVDAIECGHKVGAADISAGDMDLIVLHCKRQILVGFVIVHAEIIQVFQRNVPEHSSRIDVPCAEAVHAFNEQSPTNNLFGRAMTMTW